jgi:hypothetical protein
MSARHDYARKQMLFAVSISRLFRLPRETNTHGWKRSEIKTLPGTAQLNEPPFLFAAAKVQFKNLPS